MRIANAVQFRRFDHAGARERRDIVALIHRRPRPAWRTAATPPRDARNPANSAREHHDQPAIRSYADLLMIVRGVRGTEEPLMSRVPTVISLSVTACADARTVSGMSGCSARGVRWIFAATS